NRRKPESPGQIDDAVDRQAVRAVEWTDAEIGLRVAIDNCAAAQAEPVRGRSLEPRQGVAGGELITVRESFVQLPRERAVARKTGGVDDRNGAVRRRRESVAQDDWRATAREGIGRVSVAHELMDRATVNQVHVKH